MVDPTGIYIDGTHIKASANKMSPSKFVTMDAAHKTPWIAKKILDDGRIPILPYTRNNGRKDHFWQESLDLAEQLRKTQVGKDLYARRKETIERVFADAKEKHGMRYAHRRGLTRVDGRARLKYAAMNLEKPAIWSWKTPCFARIYSFFLPYMMKRPILAG